ncbi:hypothetical protein ADK76_29250 [Streptomyces griseoflavus]|uniref:hypothetical protein n=1 Tax=Streptomyces rimosus TaxID=1927 RepID=UPI0004C69CAE|nr:hypothetical protein [Streptomyces rimosus]KOG53040.1 hypothetical protein ADK76_29250 [Streptomyces griseoflavus]
MLTDRINLLRRLIAALSDALHLANGQGDRERSAEFYALRDATARDLNTTVERAFTNGVITDAEVRSALRPIYGAKHETESVRV